MPRLLEIARSDAFDIGDLASVKIAALRSLVILGPKDQNVFGVIGACAKSANPAVKNVALELSAEQGQPIDVGALKSVLRGLTSKDVAEHGQSERALKAMFPRRTADLVAVLADENDFVILDECAALALPSGSFSILDTLNRKIQDEHIEIKVRYWRSETREFLTTNVLLNPDAVVWSLAKRLRGEKGIRMTQTNLRNIDAVISFVSATDSFFAGQDQSYASNTQLEDDAVLLKAVAMWESEQTAVALGQFSLINKQYFTGQAVPVQTLTGTVSATEMERFRVSTRSCTGVYAACILAGFYISDNQEEKALEVLRESFARAAAEHVQVTDEEYSQLWEAYLKKLAAPRGQEPEIDPAIVRILRERFRIDSADIRHAVLLMHLYLKNGNSEKAKEVFLPLQQWWPVTLDDFCRDLRSKYGTADYNGADELILDLLKSGATF